MQPWPYSSRLEVSKEVKKVKEKVERQNIAAKTKRKTVTDFIASQKSRQEFESLIGGFIDRVHVETPSSQRQYLSTTFQGNSL